MPARALAVAEAWTIEDDHPMVPQQEFSHPAGVPGVPAQAVPRISTVHGVRLYAGKSISGRSRSLMPIPGGLPAEAIDGSTLLSAIAGDVELDNRRSGRQRLAGRTTGVDLLRAVLSAQPIIFSCHSNRTCHRRREFRRGSIPPTFVSGNFQCVGFFRIR
jgi:hypothetical protein